MSKHTRYVTEDGALRPPTKAELRKREEAGWNTYMGPRGVRRLIPLSKCRWPIEYGRIERKAKVQKIAKDFLWLAFGSIIAVEREGLYYIVDGCHRAMAARMRGIEKVPAEVFVAVAIALQAKAFRLANYHTPPTGIELFHSRVVEGDPQALALKAIVDEAGLLIAKPKSRGDRRTCCNCPETLYREMDHGHDLRAILAFIQTAWPTAPKPWLTQVITGVGAFGVDLKKRMKADLYNEEAVDAASSMPLRVILAEAAHKTKAEEVSLHRAFTDQLEELWDKRHPKRKFRP